MSVDPRLLESFVVLAEELHFTRAANRLHIARPALRVAVETARHVERGSPGPSASATSAHSVRA